jgi:predicted kinase
MNGSIDFAGEVLILTGPPGAGKTTTAERLAWEPGAPKVHLHADDFWDYVRHGRIAPWLPESHAQNVVVMEVLARVVEAYAQGGYFVVLDGIVGPWFLERFRSVAVPLHYIVLRPPLEVALARCQLRSGETLCDPEPITLLHQQFSSLAQMERHVIRTDGLSREELLSKVAHALKSGAFRFG